MPHPNERPGETTVLIDPAKLNQDWAKATDEHIPPGGGGPNEMGGKIANIKAHIASGKPLEASRVAIGADGLPTFIDGRHRFAVLGELKAPAVAVTIPKSQAAEFLSRYGLDHTSKFAAPGPPPREGLHWKEETHRWVSDESEESKGHDAATIAALGPDHADELKDPAARKTVGEKIAAARQAVYGWMVRQTPIVWELVNNIADTPDDFKKFGFAPAMSGTGQATHADPVKGAIGISGHLAINIASRVLSGAVQYAKAKLANRSEMAETDPAAALAELFGEVNKAMGANVLTTDADEIRKRLASGLTSSFAAPGPPPRDGLVWKEETHRWVNPDTGESHEPAHPKPAKNPRKELDRAAEAAPDGPVKDALNYARARAGNSTDPGALQRSLAMAGRSLDSKGVPQTERGLFMRVLAAAGVAPIHLTGNLTAFDSETQLAKVAVSDGQPVRVVYGGYRGTAPDGEPYTLVKSEVEPATAKLADDSSADSVHVNTPANAAKPVTADLNQDGEPASGEVALAGKDGKALAKLIRESKAEGVAKLHELTLSALSRYQGGPLFGVDEIHALAGALAATNATADLLGRSRVREMHERATESFGLHKFADTPFTSLSMFADGFPGVMATPHDALAYFTGLYPTLAIDPERWIGDQRRRAFTLAESTNQTLTRRVQQLIAQSLGRNESVADAAARIRDVLAGAGVTPRNPQYAEMVFRTNAMDSFQTCMWEEGRAADVAEFFPVWQYLGIDDERAGADHRPKFDRFYPALATFADVRGNRPNNCRCGMRWVDQYEWQDIQDAGGRLETRW